MEMIAFEAVSSKARQRLLLGGGVSKMALLDILGNFLRGFAREWTKSEKFGSETEWCFITLSTLVDFTILELPPRSFEWTLQTPRLFLLRRILPGSRFLASQDAKWLEKPRKENSPWQWGQVLDSPPEEDEVLLRERRLYECFGGQLSSPRRQGSFLYSLEDFIMGFAELFCRHQSFPVSEVFASVNWNHQH